MVAKADGSFVPRDREALSEHNRREREKLDNRRAREQEQAAMERQQEQRNRNAIGSGPGMSGDGMSAPHYILFVEALPKMATSEMVSTLFTQVRH